MSFDYGTKQANDAERVRVMAMGTEACRRGESRHGAGGFAPGDQARAHYWRLGWDLQAGPIRRLTCCVCGESTRGRQWWNRDDGFGICPASVEFVRSHGASEEEIIRSYGHKGIHWGVEPEAQHA